MNTSRRSRAAGAWGHLLVVVVLALGVFVMHTVGHPDGSPGRTTGSVHGAVTASAAHTASPAPESMSMSMSAEMPADMPMTMDMSSLCVAVLCAVSLLSLLRAALGSRTEWLVRLHTGVLAVLRANPPPRTPDLAELSILRI